MSATITYDQFTPQSIGYLTLTTGSVSLTTATAGVSIKSLETKFRTIRSVTFENSNGYRAEYNRTSGLMFCYMPDGTISDAEDLTFYFTAIGDGA